MKPGIIVTTALAVALLAPQAPHAQMPMTPTAGQTAEQMAADQSACATQAAAQTGYHPSQPVAPAQPTERRGGQRLAGAAPGAAARARAGAVAGGVRQRQERRGSRREAAQEQQAQAEMESAYNQAFKACLTAIGYVTQ